MYRNLIVFFLLWTCVLGAIQLDQSCLDRPQACDDDAFSVSDFVVCSGPAFGPAVDGANKGSGLLSKGCSFNENCVKVYPADEINNASWTTNASVGCNKTVWLGHGFDQQWLNDKIAACEKWFSKDVGVCQPAIWWPITLVAVILVLVITLVLVYLLKNPDQQPSFMKNLLAKKSQQEYKPVARSRRQFRDRI